MSELVKKLSKIALSAGSIKKNGRYSHKQTNYDFLRIDDIYDHFNKPMAENNVVFTTEVKEWMIQDNLIIGVVNGVFTDGKEKISCEVGSAARAGDKMMRNFQQNAVKQIFLQVFCISSGDLDPDGEENTPLEKNQEEKIYSIPDDRWEATKGSITSMSGYIASIKQAGNTYKAKLTDQQLNDYLKK